MYAGGVCTEVTSRTWIASQLSQTWRSEAFADAVVDELFVVLSSDVTVVVFSEEEVWNDFIADPRPHLVLVTHLQEPRSNDVTESQSGKWST